jgi:hypothetical protein
MHKGNHSMLRTMLGNALPVARTGPIAVALLVAWSMPGALPASAQTPKAATGKESPPANPSRAALLRGEYGPYRANNDLLYYHLDVRVDPVKQQISGKNTIRFRMLKDDDRIQLDLVPQLKVDKILQGDVALKFERDSVAVFVNFPEKLKADQVYSIDFYYSGKPSATGRFGGMSFRQDPAGCPWICTSCEGRVPASGGPTKTNGATKSNRWT